MWSFVSDCHNIKHIHIPNVLLLIFYPNTAVGNSGKYSQQMKVALVATHADQNICPRLSSGELISGEGNIVLHQIKKTFGKLFDISEVLFVVDCQNAQSRDMKLLRTHLSNLRNAILKVRYR